MKNIIFLCFMFFSLACHAARQENDLSQMIISLHQEFKFKWKEAERNNKELEQQLLDIDTLIHKCNDKSKQCVMTIFSTNDNMFQDVAYASQSALNLYNKFGANTTRYVSMLNEYTQLTHHQDSLVKVLKSVDAKTLNPNAQKILPELFIVLGKLQNYDGKVLHRLQSLRPIYNEAYQRLKQATNTSQQKYKIIRNRVLYNFEGNVFDIISDWDGYMAGMDKSKQARLAIDEKFADKLENKGLLRAIVDLPTDGYSSWGFVREILVFFDILLILFFAVAVSLAICFVRWIIKRIFKLRFWAKTRCNRFVTKMLHAVTCLSGIKTFAFMVFWTNVLVWFSMIVIFNNDEEEAILDFLANQLFYFSTLFTVIMTFFLFRYSGRQFWCSLAVCTPTLLAFAYSIISIIMIMPDDEIVVEMTFLSVIFFALQLLIYWLCHEYLDKLMERILHLCLVFLCMTMLVALSGLQFLSTMIVVFWCTFMVCMMLLTSMKRYFDYLILKYNLKGKSLKSKWWIPVMDRVLYPMAWIYAVLLSCKTACGIYSLDDFLNNLLNTYFRTPLGNISLNINLLIFICWSILLAAFISDLLYQFLDYYHKSKDELNWKDVSFFNQSTIRVLVWGITLANIMMHMGFNLQWIGYCMAGISTGLGFASRELLENLIYGLTLRNGQLKIGDWIVCEGIRGQIKSIGLLSTRMDSVEGSVITFTNGRLLNMNYENITLNHGYELLHTEFCVNVGEDIERIRHLLIDGYMKYDCYDKNRPVTVFIKHINNQQIDLDFRAWVLASERIRMAAFNQEYVYNTLSANGIKYPYTYIEVNSLK